MWEGEDRYQPGTAADWQTAKGLLVGDLCRIGDLFSIQRDLAKEGYLSVQVIPAGGCSVLLKCESSGELKDNKESGEKKVDEDTKNMNRVDVGRLLILTELKERIECTKSFNIDGCMTSVKVIEISRDPLLDLFVAGSAKKDYLNRGSNESVGEASTDRYSCWGENFLEVEDDDDMAVISKFISEPQHRNKVNFLNQCLSHKDVLASSVPGIMLVKDGNGSSPVLPLVLAEQDNHLSPIFGSQPKSHCNLLSEEFGDCVGSLESDTFSISHHCVAPTKGGPSSGIKPNSDLKQSIKQRSKLQKNWANLGKCPVDSRDTFLKVSNFSPKRFSLKNHFSRLG
ncbi:unnamed protein product [Lupinus luteus]|uniref:Uncharacterized protein n=1 Tax=Lupinus luteus TaxID=3873 RepID=A0AAV1XP02_LUPLU